MISGGKYFAGIYFFDRLDAHMTPVTVRDDGGQLL